MEIELDLREELREMACINSVAGKQKAERKYNSRLRPRELKEGVFMLRLMVSQRKDQSEGKMVATGMDLSELWIRLENECKNWKHWQEMPS